jgi:hypothetical protein
MTDWQIYWADFDAQVAEDWPPASPTDQPFGWWRTSNTRLVKSLLSPGDRLWLVTVGKLCGYKKKPDMYQVFLPQIVLFDDWDDNPGYCDPYDDTCDWRYRVWIHNHGCYSFDPPLLIEDIVFGFPPRDFPPDVPTGMRLQTPRRIDHDTVTRLKGRLDKERGITI